MCSKCGGSGSSCNCWRNDQLRTTRFLILVLAILAGIWVFQQLKPAPTPYSWDETTHTWR